MATKGINCKPPVKGDLSNICSIHKLSDYDPGEYDYHVCSMCLGDIVNGTIVNTSSKTRYGEHSENGIIISICDNCLAIILMQKFNDYDIDSSTMQYFENTCISLQEIRTELIGAIEEDSVINIKGTEYILLDKDLFDEFDELLEDVCYLRGHVKAIDKLRQSGENNGN